MTQEAVAKGERVVFKLWFRPYEFRTGIVISSKADAGRKKPFKYVVQPSYPKYTEIEDIRDLE